MKLEKNSIPLISQEIEFIRPKYNEIKSQLTRNINIQLCPDVSKFDVIPYESKFFIKHYQVFITRIYIKDLNKKTDEINIFIEKYKTMEFKLIDNGRSRNDIYEFRMWGIKECCISLI
ncbi:hypothetical protein H8356DRAFT_1326762 [Neocallimastix lanati (nom. inval.)]|nr:hypothetical protein H8356DRAFT_1326762 [Neocallimastix sp. JGI-2020a]